ncbi:MAG: NAD(P)H-hydrate dehydratase [Burkholderiaceae bacterium]|nr:NAD(P)H-hydrate dehydratase [Burkholderiaceae bacterium]
MRARARRRAPGCDAIVTPHPLEAARLLGCGVDEIQSDRIAAALRIAARLDAVVVLKGAGTVLASPDRVWAVVDEGTAALATAGTGDVLAGAIAALCARRLPSLQAAALATWLHGRAARAWQREHPHGAGLSAARLPELMTEAMRIQ